MECRRKWLLNYLRRLELARGPNDPTPNLSQGSIFHTAHELFWTKGTPMLDTVLRLQQEIHSALPAGVPLSEQWINVFKYLMPMATGYQEWVESGVFMGETVIEVEFQMRVEWRPGVYVTGKIDRLVQDNFTKELRLKDVKTVQSFTASLAHSRALLTYAVLLRRYGFDITSATTEQVKKVLRTGAAKPPFFQEAPPMSITPEMLDQHEAYMTVVIDEMLDLRAQYESGDTSALYPNPVSDCSWKCEFLPICTAMTNGEHYEHIIEMAYRPKRTEDGY
jgi:hypothetical protein